MLRKFTSAAEEALFTDFILASLHHLAVFSLIAVVAAEIVLLRPGLDAAAITRIARIDLAFGIIAAVVVIAGVLRVFFGIKGADYYLHNHVFWTKMVVFALVGILSIRPTMRFIAWRRAVAADPNALSAAKEIKAAKMIVHIEATLILLLPILAAAMARGYGSH
jgi:putative membrane protein